MGDLGIADAETLALIVAEVEFAQIALQVFLGDVMIGPTDAPLEDGEVVFDSVGVPKAAANVFLDAVVGTEVSGMGAAFLNVYSDPRPNSDCKANSSKYDVTQYMPRGNFSYGSTRDQPRPLPERPHLEVQPTKSGQKPTSADSHKET